MTAAEVFTVRFWGVRGSIACPGLDTVRYGGNTACVEVRCGDALMIFDGGTGLRPFGNALAEEGKPLDADLFYSHCHIDHICGLPFFSPAYQPGNRLRVWAGSLPSGQTLQGVLEQITTPPVFPTGLDILTALSFEDFRCGAVLTPRPGVSLRTGPLNHPGGATGYRLEFAGRSLAYLTDTEHRLEGLDPAILALAADTDLMIYDATYTEEEYPGYVGWGHSTWQEGVRLAEAAGAKRLALFHHDPGHDDAFMDRVAVAAAARRPGTVVAREGMVLEL